MVASHTFMEHALARIGLDRNEVRIYLALRQEGALLAGGIAGKTHIHRRTVYDALDKLLQKGMVTYSILSGKRHFQAVDPDRLLLYLQDKKAAIEEEEKEVTSVLSQLKGLFKTQKPRIHAEIFAGKEGIKSVMELIIREKGEWLTIGSTGRGPQVLSYYLIHFARRREKAKIRRRVLLARTDEGQAYFRELQKQKLVQARFLPAAMKHPQTIWIFGDHVAIILASTDQPVAFLISSRETAGSFREYFRWMWGK